MPPDVVRLLAARRIIDPTPLQMLAIPAVRAHKNVFIGGETGCGKTLAYLLPVVERIKQQEASDAPEARPRYPKAVVLVPSNELAQQTKRVIKGLSSALKVRSQALLQEMKPRLLATMMRVPIDVCIATPGHIVRLLAAKKLRLDDALFLVFDEADTLLDERRGFRHDVLHIAETAAKATGQRVQCVCVAATATTAFATELRRLAACLDGSSENPEAASRFTAVLAPGMHRPVRTLRHRFVRISTGGNSKQQAAERLLKANAGAKCLLFVDRIVASKPLISRLRRSGMQQFSWLSAESASDAASTPPPPPHRIFDVLHGFLSVAVSLLLVL